MRSNQLKLLLVSMLAVLAISAVSSASASAECLLVAEPEAGQFEAPSCAGAAGNKDYVKAKTVNKLKEDEWCAEVETAETGNFEDNLCTKAKVKSKFIKVYTHGFWVCKEKAGAGTEPPIKYDDHTCSTKTKPLAERKWEWRPLRGAEVFSIEGTSGVSKLESKLAGLRVIIECATDKLTGEIEAAGSSKNVVITYETCKLYEVVKYVKKLTTCTVPNIKTNKLNDLLITGTGIGPEDEFEPAEAGGPFALINIEGCSLEAAEVKVTGKQICQLPEGPVGKVEHEVVCSPTGGTLKLGANAASYFGTAQVKLTNGWGWGAE
jgi:hypothetical protein